MSKKPSIICITPVKNEAWILELFIQAASLWADYIIIADQHSDDGSREIALKFPKVKLIDNNSLEFNEPERQALLINEARKIPGEKIIVALDADEILSSQALDIENWTEIFNAAPGTAFGLKWPLINHDFNTYWLTDSGRSYFIYKDDGAEHVGQKIHSPRIPLSENTKFVNIDKFVVMHYQFTDWQRMLSKHRWYQCYERVNYPSKNQLSIYRMYHHMYNKKHFNNIPYLWFLGYLNNGVNACSIHIDNVYRWDKLVDIYLEEYGEDYFKYVDILGNDNIGLKYLRLTQKFSHYFIVRAIDKILKLFFIK